MWFKNTPLSQPQMNQTGSARNARRKKMKEDDQALARHALELAGGDSADAAVASTSEESLQLAQAQAPAVGPETDKRSSAGAAAGAAAAGAGGGAATVNATLAGMGTGGALVAGMATVVAAAVTVNGLQGRSDPTPSVAGNTLAPTHPALLITDNQPAATHTLGSAGTILYTFSFDEAVTGFDASKVNVGHGSKGNFTAVSGRVYTLEVTPTAGFEGDLTVNVAAGAASSVATGGASQVALQSVQAVDMLAPRIVEITSSVGSNIVEVSFDSSLDASNLPAADSFVVKLDGVNVAVTAVASESFGTIQLTLGAPRLAGQAMDLTYIDANPDLDDANAIQDTAGNDVPGFTLSVVEDGYLRHAPIYIFTPNGAGGFSDYFVGASNERGQFFIPQGAPDGFLGTQGGINSDNGLRNTLAFQAPAGSTVINPLTSLVQGLLRATYGAAIPSAQQIADAASQVAEVLGLTLPAGQSLLNASPLGTSNLAAQKVAVQIATLMTLGGSNDPNGGIPLFNLANLVKDAAIQGVTINLTDPNTLAGALQSVNLTAGQREEIADAMEAIGNATTPSEVGQAQAMVLDRTAPAAPVLTIPAQSSDDTPRVRVGLDTRDITGHAVVAGDQLVLLENGVEISATITLTANHITSGFVNVDTDVLTNGAHTIQAVLIDQAGNQSPLASAVTVTVQTGVQDSFAQGMVPFALGGDLDSGASGGLSVTQGSDGPDEFHGGEGNDWIATGAGNDVLDGGAGNDVLEAGPGSDTIIGGMGDDIIHLDPGTPASGPGSTVIMRSLAEGTDIVNEFVFLDPSLGGDVIDLSNIAHLGIPRTQQFGDLPDLRPDLLGDGNLFIFNTAMTPDQARQLVAGAEAVGTHEGYLIFKDADHGNQATIFHSANLDDGAALDALIVFAGTVDLQALHPSSLIL